MDNARGHLLAAATDLLSRHGAEALTVRRIAERAGVSTMGLYSHFGGKMGVVEALYLEGFERLRVAIEALPAVTDAGERLRSYSRCYRTTALANSSHYEVMFGRAVPGFQPSEAARDKAVGAFELIVDAARAAIAQGLGQPPARALAVEMWALVHGHVSLELSGDLPSGEEGERRLSRAVDHLLDGLAAGSAQERPRGAGPAAEPA